MSKLGNIGDVVSVKAGYAQLPAAQAQALRASAENKLFEAQRAQIGADNQKKREAASANAGKIAGKTVVLIRQAGDSGQLYGSVASRDIARRCPPGRHRGEVQVVLDKPIKVLGLHAVRVSCTRKSPRR